MQTIEQLAKLLRQAYNAIGDADTSDIHSYYLAVEEAQGFIAEALDIADCYADDRDIEYACLMNELEHNK
jgi:hypothetical protein